MSDKRYALKGVNDDETECSVCGRVELKRVMWLVELADGSPIGDAFPVGTTCGASLLGYTTSRMVRAARDYESNVAGERYILRVRRERALGLDQAIAAIPASMPYSERVKTPQWATVKRIQAEAVEWAEAQEVTVIL